MKLEGLAKSDIAQLRLLAARAFQQFAIGQHRSLRQGANIEFAAYRPYNQGDDLKRVDWRLFARSGRLYIRDAHIETQVNVTLLLDFSTSMTFAGKTWAKDVFARTVAKLMALVVEAQGDKLGFVGFSDGIDCYYPPKSRRSYIHFILQQLDRHVFRKQTRLATAIGQLINRRQKPGIVILISDMYAPLEKTLRSLAQLVAVGNEVIVFFLSDSCERDFDYDGVLEVVDLENDERMTIDSNEVRADYQDAFRERVLKMRTLFQGQGIHLVQLDDQATVVNVLSTFLKIKNRWSKR